MVYFHITVRKTRDELQPHIVLQEQEVSASAWFNKDLVKLAIGQRNGFLNNNEDLIRERNVPETFTIYTFKQNPGGECHLIEWPTNVLVLRLQDSGKECRDIERLSSGTIFALQEWLCSKHMS